MGVPGFYSWLIRRYPLVKHLIQKQQIPSIDYLYLDMNGIIYKCVKDDSIIFKSQIIPKEMQEIWLDIFNYINMLVNILKPNKMIMLGLDGVAPRAKMNNQRSRRFKSSRDHKKFMEKLYGFTGQTQSTQNFKNNSISPGTAFMQELGNNLQFFIKKKIQQDDYWKSLSIIFTSSSSPGQGQHKIMEFIRANKDNFLPEDNHCLYGADADLIMLSMTLPLKNLCIIREQFVPGQDKVKIAVSKKQKTVNFEMIFVTILRQYFQIEYQPLKQQMKIPFDLDRVLKDFVFLFFFIGNDFLPRCMAYNIRQSSIQDLIDAFKQYLIMTQDYLVGPQKINMKSLTSLANAIALRQSKFISQKFQDYEKINQQQKDKFQGQFRQMIKQKTMKEKDFINQLKTFYMNDQIKTRSIYYGQYFGIEPAQKSQQFYQVLNYYLYGLQFVYQYYFINLPSWQWFYPYYCAPLVSDLFYYLNYLSQNNHQLPKIQPGTPSQPFKQLLCILPKQSCQLLPQPFRQYLLDQNSILRKPIDYYPDTFQQQPYGALKQHEHIAIIPFLDLNIINKVYDQAIGKVQAKDIQRNQFKLSTLYQFDKNAKQIIIQSKFKSIPITSCTILETPVNLRQRIKWGTNSPKIRPKQQNLIRMPSLKTKNFYSTSTSQKRRKFFYIQLKNQQNQRYKIGNQVFYGYPLQKSGKIEATLSREEFNSIGQFDARNYDLDRVADFKDNRFLKQNPKQAFQVIKNHLIKESRFQFNWQQLNDIVFAIDAQEFVRCLDGNFRRVYTGSQRMKYQIVPTTLISNKKVYENTMDKIQFKRLQDQFWEGQDVLIFPESYGRQDLNKNYVQKGKVVGYTHNKVKVKLGQKIQQIQQKMLNKVVHTRQIYFTLRFCAFILQVKQDVLLTLLESINIQVDHPQMPPSIDIGLNFINRYDAQLVPNLVRINFQGIRQDLNNPQKLFRMLDISLKGLQLIIQYKKTFPNIFEFIQKRYDKLIQKSKDTGDRIQWRQKIKLSQIYQQQKQSQKALKSLMNIYLWIIKRQQTQMPLSSIYSKQISVKNIRKLQQQFAIINNQQKQKKHKYAEPRTVQIDPNYLFSRRLATYGKMFLRKGPISSTIRDQVICLQPQFFGEQGVIIGFDYNKYQVMFKRPSFGKSDLGGICGNLWAGKFYERDLYNFYTWPENMCKRYQTKNKAENIGWNGSQLNKMIQPKFKQNALREFADIEKLADKNFFSPQFLAFIQNAKKNQKVSKIQQDFQVVDNRKGDYTYKYDKGKPTIEKQYIEKIVKDKKYIEKPIEPSIKSQVVQKQIIQNKAEQKTEQQSTKIVEGGEEDDGDDMLK